MRALVIICASLAILKVWTQDTLYRSAVSEVLVDAYRPRAEKICDREAGRLAGAGAGAAEWSMPADDAISVGSKVANVMIWDYHNPLWAVRFRHPHLIMTTTAPRKLRCSFDLTVGVAFIEAL